LHRKEHDLFEFKSESDKLIAVLSEKLKQQEEQHKTVKEKLKLKDEELNTN